MIVRFIEEAQHEFLDAISYYEDARAGFGRRFKDQVDQGVLWIADHPELYRVRPGGYRQINLRVFPYCLPYISRDKRFGCLPWRTAAASRIIGFPGATKSPIECQKL